MTTTEMTNAPPIRDEEATELRRALVLAGYTEFLATFEASVVRSRNVGAYRHNAARQARVLVDFLYLNQQTHTDTLDEVLGTSWRVLADAGIASISGDWVSITNHSLYYHEGMLFFADSATSVDPNVYFGDDSIGLSSRITPLSTDTVLDLCSGSGFQALCSARFVRKVYTVEINPKARQLLHFNRSFNGFTDRIEIFGGSLYADLPVGVAYDLVTANPPLIPFPDSITYPFIGHGGSDGLAVTREIVRGLPSHLSESGRAQIVALAFSDGLELLVHDEIASLAKDNELDILVTIVRQLPASPDSEYFRGLLLTAAVASEQTPDEIRSTLQSEMRSLGATHVAPYFLQIKRGSGQVSYQNFSRAREHALWHVIA